MKNIFIIAVTGLLMAACGGGTNDNSSNDNKSNSEMNQAPANDTASTNNTQQ